MVGELFKRFMNGVVVMLAALSFFLVPIGKKTTAQHLVAIFSTRPAREAATSFSGVARRIAAQLAVEVRKLEDAHAKPPQSKSAPAKSPSPT